MKNGGGTWLVRAWQQGDNRCSVRCVAIRVVEALLSQVFRRTDEMEGGAPRNAAYDAWDANDAARARWDRSTRGRTSRLTLSKK